MNILGWALVIFVIALAVILGAAWLLGRGLREFDRIKLRGELDQAVNPYCPDGLATCQISHAGYPRPELPIAGYFDLPGTLARFAAPDGPYGPFPANTGPLLILSEKDAANAALEREIPRLCAEAEAKIPPRWR